MAYSVSSGFRIRNLHVKWVIVVGVLFHLTTPARTAEAPSGKRFAILNPGELVASIGNPHQGSTLSNGVPAAFSFPAVSQPTLFTGDNALVINVPPGVTELQVRLDTNTPARTPTFLPSSVPTPG